jgi:outer membrane lipoprotein-sorting protein
MRTIGLVLLAVVVLSSTASAAPTAEEALASVDTAYANVTTAEMTFEQATTDALVGGSPKKSEGKLFISRPSLRWEYRATRKNVTSTTKVFLASPKKIIFVDHLNKQYMVQPVGANQTPVALSFLTGAGRLAKEFTPTLTASTATTLTLTLAPNTPSTAYASIELVVDATTFHVQKSTVTDSSGNTNSFTFTKATLGGAISPDLFKLNPKSPALKNYRKVRFQPPAGPKLAAPATGSGSGSRP